MQPAKDKLEAAGRESSGDAVARLVTCDVVVLKLLFVLYGYGEALARFETPDCFRHGCSESPVCFVMGDDAMVKLLLVL